MGTSAAAALPAHVVRIAPTAYGIELYFPPLRTPAVAGATAAFGVLCIVPSLIATAAFIPADRSDASGILSFVLLVAFSLSFLAFGAVFVAMAAYILANSLTVKVSASAISTTRRVLSFGLSHRELKRAEIAAIEPEISAKYQSLFAVEPRYRLVARAYTRGSGRATPRLIVAEGLVGERAMEQVRSLIAANAGLQYARESS